MKKCILILIVFILVSCNFNKTYENREEDKKDAEKITQKFFSLIKENNKQEAFKLFSNKFFKVTNRTELNQMFDWTNKEAGNILNDSLSTWQTTVIKGTDPKSDYLMTYYVKRNKINTEEIFSLQKEGDNIKIVGYKINLDVMKPK